MKKGVLIFGGLLLAGIAIAATRKKEETAPEPEQVTEDVVAEIVDETKERRYEIQGWLSTTQALTKIEVTALLKHIKTMTGNEINDLYRFLFSEFQTGKVISDLAFLNRLKSLFKKYSIFTMYILKAPSTTITKKITAPVKETKVTKGAATVVKKPVAKVEKTQTQKVQDLIIWLATYKKIGAIDKLKIITSVKKMSATELADTTNYIFNYTSTGKKVTDPTLMARLKTLSTKYGIFK